MFEVRFQTFDDSSERAESASRVAALRAEFKRRGLDGFVVPRADRQQNEYLPASEERLAWLTGFTGSAGVAIVLADCAVLFVDGRYTVQAAAQVDVKVFAIAHLVDSPPDQWLEQNLKAGAKIGYDPWLHSADGAERLKKACEAAGATLVAVESNPIDALWTNRPAPPSGAVVVRDAKFAGESAADKLRRVRSELGKLRADALVVSDPQNVAWAFNIRGSDVAHTPLVLAFAVVPKDGLPALYVESSRLDKAAQTALKEVADVRPPDRLIADLAALKDKTVRLDQVSAAEALTRLITASGGKPVRGPDPITLMKAVKNPAEIEGARQAHRRDGAALAHFLAWLDKEAPAGKLTEIDAVAALESFRRDTGKLKDISFPTIAGSGPNGAIVHYRVTKASNRRIGADELFLVDSGAQYEDGTTDVTRTVIVGAPTEEMRDRFTRVLKGHIAIATAVFPEGTSGAQLDSLARLSLWQAGLDFDHGTGHGVGSYLVGARGTGAHFQARQRGAQARHDPVQRARLLQDRRLRHPHREPGAGDRGAGAGRRREAAQRIRDADACTHRPAADRDEDAHRQGARLGGRLPRARARGDFTAGGRADAGVAGGSDAAVVTTGAGR